MTEQGPDGRHADALRPLLIVVSAPSGAGKTMLREWPRLEYSVSCTTRAPRAGERDGRDYHFLAPADFERRLAGGEFLEHAEVHGFRYGTLRAPVEAALAQGRSVLMDIDVQGAAQVRAALAAAGAGDALAASWVDVFIAPPSLEALRERLERRGKDSPETIARRLGNAAAELARRGEYRYVVVNDELERAYAAFRDLLVGEAGGDRN